MAYTFFNLRSTLGFVSDPVGSSFAPSAAYTTGPTGYASTTGFPADNSAGNTAQLAGNHNLSTLAVQFRVNLAAGNYNLKLAGSAAGTSARQAYCVWDGAFSDGATAISTANSTNYAATTTYALNRYTLFGNRLLKATTAGTTGTGFAPSGPGPYTDGSVVWTLVKTAVASGDSLSAIANGSVVGAAGTSHTFALWSTNNVPVAFTTSAGFITVTRGQLATINLRTVGYEAASTPLGPLTFRDTYGAPVEAPSLLANQPPGFPSLQITGTSGTLLPDNITFGGSLAPYFTPALLNGLLYAVRSATRLPDSLVGSQTLTVIQTDTSPTITGSPFVTSLPTCTVLTSNGRSTANTLLGSISTGAYLLRERILAAHAGRWAGYTGQAFASDQFVTSSADYIAKWNALTPDGVSWYRLRFREGVYTGLIYPASKNFGSGGVLLEPDAGHDPAINHIVATGYVVKGLHVRNMLQPMVLPGGAFYAWRFASQSAGYSLRAIFENMRFGAMFDPAVTEETLTVPANAYPVTPFFTSQGEQFEVLNCVFDGCAQCIGITGVRLGRVEGCIARRSGDDFLAVAIQGTATEPIGVLPDDHCYMILRNNMDHREIDYEGFTTLAHRDAVGSQVRPNLDSPYAAQRINAKNPVNWAVGNRFYSGNGWWRVSAITTGVASGVPPVGTANGQVLGGITVNYGGPYNNARELNMLVESSTHNSVRVLTTDIADGQFTIDSQGDYGVGGNTYNVLFLDNISSGASAFGITTATAGFTYAEFNTMVGPSSIQAGNTLLPKFITASGAAKLYAANNITGALPAGVAGSFGQYYNAQANWAAATPVGQRPGDVMVGPFTQDATGRWGFALTDMPGLTIQELRGAMQASLLAKPGTTVGAPTGATVVLPPSKDRPKLNFGFSFRF